jgi:hypothetical protein
MKKAPKTDADPDMLSEYDFRKGVRGKYAQRYAEGTNIVVLAPDVAAVFPDSESVNEALRALVQVARKSAKKAGKSKNLKRLLRERSKEAPTTTLEDYRRSLD